MREILFRGKCTEIGRNYGNWIYGYLGAESDGKMFIAPIKEDGSALIGYFCDPDTISEYTGLTANGKKIFEGDILSIAQNSDGMGQYYYPPIPYPAHVVVKWDLCSWMWEVIGKDKYYLSFPDAWCHYDCEVIGNIHDNPELLEDKP